MYDRQPEYFRAADRRDYGRRDIDRRFDRRDGEDRYRGNKFGTFERQKLREYVTELGQNWEEIGRKMDRSPYDCQRQWLFWDSQPDWTEQQDVDTAVTMFNEGNTVQEIADKLNRSAIGVRAKLQIMNNNSKLTKPFEPEGEESPFLIKLVLRSEKLIDLGKELQNSKSNQKETIDNIKKRIEQCLQLINDEQRGD